MQICFCAQFWAYVFLQRARACRFALGQGLSLDTFKTRTLAPSLVVARNQSVLLRAVLGVRFLAAGSSVAFRARPARMIRHSQNSRFSSSLVVAWNSNVLLRVVPGRTVSCSGLVRGVSRSASAHDQTRSCLLYTSPSPRDLSTSRMPSSA